MGRIVRVAGLVGLIGASGCFFDSRMLQSRSLSPQQDAERRALAEIMPVPVVQPPPTLSGPVRTRKVRVWADASYRRRPHWRDHIESIFAHANEYLEGLAVKLEPDIQVWGHDGDSPDLVALLGELVDLDPGDGIDHVIGFTASLPRVSASHDALGYAETPGKHIIIRALNDGLERNAIAEALPTLKAREIDQVHDARVAHKEVIVLVHEWAHNLGAEHERGEELIMSDQYDRRASRLSEASLAVVARALAGEPPLAPATVQTPTAAIPTPAPAATGQFDAAIAAAETEREHGRRKAGLAALDAVKGRSGVPSGDWIQLASAYARLGAFTRADEALARATDGTAVDAARRAAHLWRAQRGVHGVAPEDEPEATAAVEAAHAAVASENEGVGRLLDDGLRRWPRLAGLLALRCGVEMQAGKTKVAGATCRRALAVSDETLLAHFFAGQIAANSGRRDEAIRHLERAIALDPDASPAYEILASVYQSARRVEPLIKLRADYKQRFGRSLP